MTTKAASNKHSTNGFAESIKSIDEFEDIDKDFTEKGGVLGIK